VDIELYYLFIKEMGVFENHYTLGGTNHPNQQIH